MLLLESCICGGMEKYMARAKYRKKYAEELLTYFFKFIEMRDDPEDGDEAERRDLLLMEPGVDGVFKTIPPKPASGYPTLTKFAIMKGVSPRTLTNWRQKYKEFDEACEFAEAVYKDILEERALTCKWDSKSCLKILELRAAAKKEGIDESGGAGGRRFTIDITRHVSKDSELKIEEWEGEVAEDESYKPKSD